MSNAVQLSLPLDLTPCGPVVEAAERAAVIAGIRDKVDSEDMTDAWDLYTPDYQDA